MSITRITTNITTTMIDKKKPIIRMCCYTRNKKPVSNLFRIVKTPSGQVMVEKEEKLLGRGAYLSKDKDVILSAKKKSTLNRALKCQVNEEIYLELLELL